MPRSVTKIQSYYSVGISGVGGVSNSNTRSRGSIVFIFYVKSLLVAWINFIGMKSSLLKEHWSGKEVELSTVSLFKVLFQVTVFKYLL